MTEEIGSRGAGGGAGKARRQSGRGVEKRAGAREGASLFPLGKGGGSPFAAAWRKSGGTGGCFESRAICRDSLRPEENLSD